MGFIFFTRNNKKKIGLDGFGDNVRACVVIFFCYNLVSLPPDASFFSADWWNERWAWPPKLILIPFLEKLAKLSQSIFRDRGKYTQEYYLQGSSRSYSLFYCVRECRRTKLKIRKSGA